MNRFSASVSPNRNPLIFARSSTIRIKKSRLKGPPANLNFQDLSSKDSVRPHRSITETIIAVDGPAGAGKSTVARLLARQLGYAYLDTGAMYRAIAWALLQEGFESVEREDLESHLPRLSLDFSIENGALNIYFRGKRLDHELRMLGISEKASRISQIKSVRTFLTSRQRQLAKEGKLVAEGRDMGTVVFPDAAVKVYLTADLPTRAQRRHAEYVGKGVSISYSALEAQIGARDAADQERSLAPLRPSPDALVLDTSGMTIPEVLSRLIEFVSRKVEGTDSTRTV
jgi:cytidylate kinase